MKASPRAHPAARQFATAVLGLLSVGVSTGGCSDESPSRHAEGEQGGITDGPARPDAESSLAGAAPGTDAAAASEGGSNADGDRAAQVRASGSGNVSLGGAAADGKSGRGRSDSGAAGGAGLPADSCAGCLIAGVCVEDGFVNEGNPCRWCDVSSSSGSWSDRDGASCDDGTFCNGSDTCLAGSCSQSTREDPCFPTDTCNPCTDACCGASTTRVCGADGNVHAFDSCGEDLGAVEVCPTSHGFCANGECLCEPGWSGDDCSRCVRYVHPDGSNAGPGTSWTNPYKSLSYAVHSSDCDVWVAGGSYSPGSSRENTFSIPSGRRVYGGFARYQASAEDRDFSTNPSILTGELGVPGDPSDDTLHVVTLGDRALIDGFTVTRGNAAGDPNELTKGSAILVGGFPAATLRNCRIIENEGTAVYSATNLSIESCSFENNGAGVWVDGGVVMRHCQASGNTGTAVHAITSLTAEGCSFDNNGAGIHVESTGTVVGSWFFGNGAGFESVGNNASGASSTITDCVFRDNETAVGNGRSPMLVEGTEFVTNGTGIWIHYEEVAISNSLFRANANSAVRAASHAAATIIDSRFLEHPETVLRASSRVSFWNIEGSTFQGNHVGIHGREGNVSIDRSVFANSTGSSIILDRVNLSNSVFYGSTAPVLELSARSGSSRIVSCTFFDNFSAEAGSIVTGFQPAPPLVTSSILWNNGPALFDGNVTLEYNAIEGELGSTGTNIKLDPQFASTDPASPEFLHLQRCSPCVDRAPDDPSIPEVDLRGRERYDVPGIPNHNGGSADLGAYEWIAG